MAFDLTAALIDLPPHIYNNICWVITILCTILTIIGGSYHIYHTTQWLIADKERNKTSKFRRRAANYHSVYLSFLMIANAFTFMLVTLHMTYTETYETSLTQCHIVKYTATVFYTSFKAVLYTILVLRLWQTFSDKIIVDYSQKWLCCWMLTVYCWTLMTNTINFLTTKIKINERGVCENEWSVSFLVSVATLDILAAVLYSYLFVKPILILIGQEMNAGNLKLKRTAVKQCVLSMVASGSTLLAAVFVFTFHMTQVFACLDVVISCFSVILMYKWHRNLWHVLGCGKCVRRFILNEKEKEIDRLMSLRSRRITFTSTTDTMATIDMSGQSRHSGTGGTLRTTITGDGRCSGLETTSSKGLSLGPAVTMEEFVPTRTLSPLAPPALSSMRSDDSVVTAPSDHEHDHVAIDITDIGDRGDVTDITMPTADLLDVPSDSNDHERIGSHSVGIDFVPKLGALEENITDLEHSDQSCESVSDQEQEQEREQQEDGDGKLSMEREP